MLLFFLLGIYLSACVQVTERKSKFAKLEATDCGKPLDEAAWDIVCLWNHRVLSGVISCILSHILVKIVQDDVASCFEYFADLAEALDAEQKASVPLPMETFKCYLLKEPIGVVGLITPWYFSY